MIVRLAASECSGFRFEGGGKLFATHDRTLWGAYNAVIRHEDYRKTTEAGPDRRLNRVWFGAGAEVKLRALNAARDLMESWR
jgi:hypothetical protein